MYPYLRYSVAPIEQNGKTTPCIRYAQGVLSGTYNDKLFDGLLRATVQKLDREERGVGMQNFKYAPTWDETCNILNIASPSAYRLIREHLAAPAARTFRKREARQPRFPLEICDETFQLVVDYLKEIDYSGSTSLSCDDTKLFSTFRLYWDAKKGKHFLIGGTDGPIFVADPENMRDILATSQSKKATKVSTINKYPKHISDLILRRYVASVMVSRHSCSKSNAHNRCSYGNF